LPGDNGRAAGHPDGVPADAESAGQTGCAEENGLLPTRGVPLRRAWARGRALGPRRCAGGGDPGG